MDLQHAFEIMQQTLEDLSKENQQIPIIVEGEKDVAALRKLNITGTIITINTGKSLIDFSDAIAREYKTVIILTDWDRKGGFLCRTLLTNLAGRVNCITIYRELLAKHTMVKTIEGLPSYISKMQKQIMQTKNQTLPGNPHLITSKNINKLK